jgi:hypothetical protein
MKVLKAIFLMNTLTLYFIVNCRLFLSVIYPSFKL